MIGTIGGLDSDRPAIAERLSVETPAGGAFRTQRPMNILLWILQLLLAAAFLAHGLMFLMPPAAMVEQMNAMLPRWFQLFLGLAEVAAAVGLTLPGLTRVLPWLVPCAAAGVMVVMIAATMFHLMRGEIAGAATTVVLLGMASAVAYLRWRVMPIRPRAVV